MLYFPSHIGRQVQAEANTHPPYAHNSMQAQASRGPPVRQPGPTGWTFARLYLSSSGVIMGADPQFLPVHRAPRGSTRSKQIGTYCPSLSSIRLMPSAPRCLPQPLWPRFACSRLAFPAGHSPVRGSCWYRSALSRPGRSHRLSFGRSGVTLRSARDLVRFGPFEASPFQGCPLAAQESPFAPARDLARFRHFEASAA